MSDAPRSTLYILRHAHSSWALPGQRDHQRELDERGRDDAPRIGAEFALSGYAIDAVVCSTAVRAAQTLDAIRPSLAAEIPVTTSDDLYALGVDAYIETARQSGVGSLLLVGHNPMVEDVTLSLCADGDPRAFERLRRGFPTAGLAVVSFATPLSEIVPGSGRLERLLTPDDLGAADGLGAPDGLGD